MKTVIIAGMDNLVFFSADLIDPKEYKLVGYASPLQNSWNIYDENGNVKETLDDIPVMPIEATAGYEPDCIITASSTSDDEDRLKYIVYRTDYRGEVISLFVFLKAFRSRLPH